MTNSFLLFHVSKKGFVIIKKILSIAQTATVSQIAIICRELQYFPCDVKIGAIVLQLPDIHAEFVAAHFFLMCE